MSRILFAWELGANYGHLARQLPQAIRLRELGHDVFFAVRDTTTAAQVLAPLGFRFVQAPLNTGSKRLLRPPANYAEMLIATGYGDSTALKGLAYGWLSLIDLFKADIVVADHAPTALFASHLAGIPRIAVGNGFEIPPARSPMPSIRPWETIPEDRLARADAVVLDALRSAASALGGCALGSIAELFTGGRTILSTFAELDHYGSRDNEVYAGPIYSKTTGQNLRWEQAKMPYVFAYLRPNVRGFESILQILAGMPVEVVLVAPGIKTELARTLQNRNFRIANDPVRLEELLESAHLAISFGGTGTVSLCLLAGVPLLLFPQNVEQYLISRCVEKLGAGIAIRQSLRQPQYLETLERVLQDPAYRQRAKQFAIRYGAFTPQQAIDKTVSLIQTML